MDTITLTPELVKLRDHCRRLINNVLPELQEAHSQALGEAIDTLGKGFDINYDCTMATTAESDAYRDVDRSDQYQGAERAGYKAALAYYKAGYRLRACETEILHVTEKLRLGLYILAMEGSMPEGVLIG